MSDVLEELESMLEHAPAIAERLTFGDALEHAQQQIAANDELPEQIELCALVLEQLTPLRPEDADLAGQTVKKLTSAVEELNLRSGRRPAEGREGTLEPIKDGQGLREIQHALRDASTALTGLRTALVTTWKTRAKSQFGSLATIARVLEGIESTRAFGRALGEWAGPAMAVTSPGWFPSKDDVEQLKLRRAELPGKVAGLQSAGIDERVQSFLLEVANDTATLASVDAHLLHWLTKHDASTRFEVKAIAPTSNPAPRRGERV